MTMVTWLKRLLAPPKFKDEDKTRVAGLLNTILLVTLALSAAYGIASLLIYPDPTLILKFVGAVVVLGSGALLLMRRGYVQFASVSLSLTLWAIVTFGVFVFGGVRGPSLSGYFIVILIAGLLLGGRAGIAFAGLSVAGGWGVLQAELNGLLRPSPIPITAASTWTLTTMVFILASVLLYLAIRNANDALERARRQEQALAQSNHELQHEIAAREKIEEALRESRALFQSLLSSLPQNIYSKDLQGRFVFANPSYCATAGKPLAAILGKTDFDLHPPDLAEKYRQDDLQVVKNQQTFETVEEHQPIDGENIYVQVIKTPLYNARGQTTGTLGIFWDITDRVRMEKALEAYAARLEQSNRELQDFLFAASHHLQEPLRKVQTFSDRLQAKYTASLDQRGQYYLVRMQNAARRMQNLLNALLTYSYVTTQVQTLKPVNLNHLMQKIISDLRGHIEQVGGKVEVGDLPTIEADATQIYQLFLHLIGNALKFHRPDLPPLVKVHAKLLKSRTRQSAGSPPDAGFYEITIQDNGIGFDEKYLDRIFQVFQCLYSPGEYEGTGIGLATCRKIVERHGGEITAQGKPGQGAIFIVILPVKQPTGEIQ
jgi:PAS domain S-box-containing protein